ncbi:hypothetical protein GQ55_8G234600 [Panicum hallii var. hallii]|uniref:Uncharacterized protein n=1 Tax=Panicum hallii var. hallii TaxID=1504633 RepID=A0A2T7CQM3_9POAL|nr:hypothetical protein GQ55_8G234600 [Panicum hallii var. hallii]
MAANCFGAVVNDDTLHELSLPVTRENRAQVAWSRMYIDDKKGQASKYVANLKDMYGTGVSTWCLLYNATGDSLRYSNSHSWLGGSIYNPGYPEEIGNGQWAAFLHVHGEVMVGSLGAVVYRGKNRHGQDQDFLLAWSTPWNPIYTNKAYCEFGPVNIYEERWDEMANRLDQSGYVSHFTVDGVEVHAETERGGSPMFTATIKLS